MRAHRAFVRRARGRRSWRSPAARAAGSTRAGPATTVRFAAYDFSENQILVAVYAEAARRAGVPVSVQSGVATREVVEPALEQGVVDVVIDYLESQIGAYRTLVSGNTFIGFNTGSSIALEGDAAAPGTFGASDTVIIGNTIHGSASGGIALNNGGGITRGTVIAGNRIQVDGGGAVGIFVDTDTQITQVTGNNFSNTAVPITDNSTTGVVTSGNWPPLANFSYGGTIASAASINMRCGQTATISGTTGITDIELPTDSFGGGAQGLGQGCTVNADSDRHLGYQSSRELILRLGPLR